MGKNENVLELPKNHFKDIKKLQIFQIPVARGGGTNIWKIPYVFCRKVSPKSVKSTVF